LFVATVLTVAACSRGHDTTAATSTAATASTAPATAPAPPITGPVPTVAGVPGRRSLDVRDVRLARGEALGIALHPDGATALASSTDDLEVCPATTDGDIDLGGGSWPGDVFDGCIPFAAGHATVPGTPVNTFHVGFAVRARGAAPVTIDHLGLDYAGVDQFFLVRFPPLGPDAASAEVVVAPKRSTTVVAEAQSPGVEVHVTQSARPLGEYPPGPQYQGTMYGPVELGGPVTVTLTAARAVDRPSVVIEWS
jgi:hypothetical protein